MSQELVALPHQMKPTPEEIARGVSEHFPDPSARKSIDVDLALLERYDSLITDLELTIVREAKRHDGDAFHRLRSVPGIGKVLALTILYEIHGITRFDREPQ